MPKMAEIDRLKLLPDDRVLVPSRGRGRPSGPAKEQILDAAERLFAAHGYDGVALRAIAAGAGTTQGLLTYHFSSKAELYRAMWERWFQGPPMPKSYDPMRSREAQLREFVTDYFLGPLALFKTPMWPDRLSILGREFYDPNAAARGLLQRFLDPSEAAYIENLKALLPGIDETHVSVMYRLMSAGGHALMFQYLSSRRPADRLIQADLDRSVQLAADFVLAGLFAAIAGANGAPMGRE